jgi:hypothetical protein
MDRIIKSTWIFRLNNYFVLAVIFPQLHIPKIIAHEEI